MTPDYPHYRADPPMTFEYVEYRLAFDGPLRLGDAHHEAAATAWPRLHSDLLYRAVASAWRELQPGDSPALPGWPEAPQVRLSSAFPFTRPHGCLAPVPAATGSPDDLLRVAAAGEGPVTAIASEHWSVSRRARASFNRRTGRRDQRFAISEVRFADDAGLWFGARFASPDLRSQFEAVLRVLGDSGIGGGRSTGGGAFQVVAANEITPPVGDASSALWVLSRYRPSEAEFAAGSLLQAPGMPAWSAWPVPGTTNELRYLGEGSVITSHSALDPAVAGTCTTVELPGKPDGSPRAGFLFAVPVPAVPAIPLVPAPAASS